MMGEEVENDVKLRRAVKAFEAVDIPTGFINKGTFAKEMISDKTEINKYYFHFGLLLGMFRERLLMSSLGETYKRRLNNHVNDWMHETAEKITQLDFFRNG